MNAFYLLAWATLLLPLAGALASFIAETPRRAAQICTAFILLSLLVALTVLGYRFLHYKTSAIPDESVITFFSIRPSQNQITTLPSDFHPQVGVRIDNLSASFMALIAFLALAVQAQASVVLRGDAAYRRFFWAGSLLTTGLLAVAASPSLFQTWLALGLVTAATLVLALHWWQRQGASAAARRAFLFLLAGDLGFLLALVLYITKLGSFAGSLPPPPNQDVADAYSYQLAVKAWDAAHAGLANGVGTRTLVVLAALCLIVALVHSAQVPFSSWYAGLVEAPLAVLTLLGVSLVSGVLVLARVYPLLLDAPHVLSVLAVVAAVGAVVLSCLCLVSRDIYRIAALSVAAQIALAITALGTGGYSPGLLAAFAGAPAGVLLFATAGSLVRSYRTRDIVEMGGAWSRMRPTSIVLAIWALAVGGLDLVGYDALSAVLRNRFPNDGHTAHGIQVTVAILTVVALVVTAAYASRVLFTVCAGKTVRRRGYPVERIVEAEPRQRRTQVMAAGALVLAILVGIPGPNGFSLGRTHIPGLTFSHWIFLGGGRQVLPVNGYALLISVATIAVGAAFGRLVGSTQRADLAARLGRLRQLPVQRWLRPVRLAGGTVTAMVGTVDESLLEPLLDAPGEGVAGAAPPLGRLRLNRLGAGLAAVLIIVLLLVGASVLAAGGRLPVHTT